jgi:hypothetical protein
MSNPAGTTRHRILALGALAVLGWPLSAGPLVKLGLGKVIVLNGDPVAIQMDPDEAAYRIGGRVTITRTDGERVRPVAVLEDRRAPGIVTVEGPTTLTFTFEAEDGDLGFLRRIRIANGRGAGGEAAGCLDCRVDPDTGAFAFRFLDPTPAFRERGFDYWAFNVLRLK